MTTQICDEQSHGASDGSRPLVHAMRSLLDNLPALCFLKDAATGRYIVCNRAFAAYTNKSMPEEIVGLTDRDLFDPQMADALEASDTSALSSDDPQILFEDIPDATGTTRHFQSIKQVLVDENGRRCLLGMAMDVTELIRLQDEHEQTKVAYRKALSTSAIYQSIINALADDFFDLFYVNIETGAYVEYGSRTNEGTSSEHRGDDFFAESQQNARSVIYDDDQGHVTKVLTKEELLEKIETLGVYVYEYRLLVDGKPRYVSMKATRIAGDDEHIIIGVSDVDAHVKDRMTAERAAEEQKSYQRLSALNSNLMVLYYVDPKTGAYTEYSSSESFNSLGIAKQGADFFGTTYQNSLDAIHPDDQALFHAQVTQENVLATIEKNGMFVLDYRLVIDGTPMYVQFRAAMTEENGQPLLIIGLLDEDMRVRQEREYARQLSVAKALATIDSLTGVKNKHAYEQWEERIDAAIASGEQEPFAVVVCDINNLKAVNDLYGHKEGDTCIKNACMKVCKVFSHSPVFRIGGDEFAVLLSGMDYENRQILVESINALPQNTSRIKMGETVSAGMVEYKEGRHTSLASVFEEADKAMYERKQHFKAMGTENVRKTAIMPPQDEAPIFNARKLILIADDIESNREILGDLLEEDYDILYAADGIEALNILQSRKDEISLVLLDLYMPNMSGREVIASMQVDEDLMAIPVIILTVDQQAELDCLKIGAMDFIPKPYPDIEIVKARISKCIELSEGRELIRHTSHDKLTGLLTREYFYRYVRRLDHIHKDAVLDAVVCNVNRFHSVNKQYGRHFGNQVLRRIGASVRNLAQRASGIACRQEGDTFLLYGSHQQDYEQLIQGFLADLYLDQEIADRITLRFGICVNAQREPNIEERFVFASIAAERMRDDPSSVVGIYELT